MTDKLAAKLQLLGSSRTSSWGNQEAHIRALLDVVEAAASFSGQYQIYVESRGGLYGGPMTTLGRADLLGTVRGALAALAEIPNE